MSGVAPDAGLRPGFADPVLDATRVFRAVMDATARPGTVRRFAVEGLDPPAPLTAELAAVALTLADHEAPLWLDAALARVPAVAAFLRFHTGARVVAEPRAAAFALVADPLAMPPHDAFHLGTEDDPDLSATVVVAVDEIAEGDGIALEGPGIASRAAFAARPLPPGFAGRLAANRALYPRGADHLLVAPGGRVLGLPRSASVVGGG